MQEIKTDLLIIGAGPAGLSAAIYAARSALDFKIVDKFMAGGQIINTEFIENYPGFKENISGFDLMQNIIAHCKKFDITIEEYSAINKISIYENSDGCKQNNEGCIKPYKFICYTDSESIISRALIIATGANPKRLNVEGESEYIGKGISFCATCDGALYKDREVIVMGGGNAAVQEALFLTKFAKKVYIVHRRDALRAVQLLQNRAFEDKKIEFLFSSVIEKFTGKERLEEVLIKNLKDNTKYAKKIDGVFEYIGINSNNDLVKDLVKLDKEGFVVTNCSMETTCEGIFAAGDVRDTPLRQVITAASDGAIAASYADKYVNSLV